MTPENRARLHSVLRDSLSRAVLPTATPHGPDGSKPGTHSGRGPHAPSLVPPRPTPIPTPAPAPVGDPATPDSLADRFRREADALTVRVYVAKDEAEATENVLGILVALEAKTVLAWDAAAIGLSQLPDALARAGITAVPQDVPFDPKLRTARLKEMAAAAAGITGATAGLADTGSLVLSHGPARGRLASLLPPIHIAVLRRSAIVSTFSQLLERQPTLADASSNLVLITGPSRTADIEMTLSRGVHGPKEVHVVLL